MLNERSSHEITCLDYLIVNGGDLDAWRRFAGPSLGMQVVDDGSSVLRIRMDEYAGRIVISSESAKSRYTMGWRVDTPEVLYATASRLECSGVKVVEGSQALADQRSVDRLVCLRDPGGNNLELFCGPILAEAPFVPGRTHSGFRTGRLGFGHIALTTACIEKMLPFYRDLLGFGVSDYQTAPFHAYFLHVNQRHHSLALINTGQEAIHHVMIEHTMLDDVGQALDVVKASSHEIGVTLGRHSNDFMTSFYVQSPSPFLVECGWGGLEIDPATHETKELCEGPSIWGHDRSWLSKEQFAEADRMRLKAARDGLQAPVNVLPGRYVVAAN